MKICNGRDSVRSLGLGLAVAVLLVAIPCTASAARMSADPDRPLRIAQVGQPDGSISERPGDAPSLPPATGMPDAGPSAQDNPAADNPSGDGALDAAPQGVGEGESGDAGSPDAGTDAPALDLVPEDAQPGGMTQMRTDGELNADLPHDLSPMGMFMGADIVVKTVMVGLALASFITWIIWLAKSIELVGGRNKARRVLAILSRARSLDDAVTHVERDRGPAALMVRAAREEARLSAAALDLAGGDGLKDRISSVLERIEMDAGRRMSRGAGILATIGSTAPFVGLFGTVWGIMNAFIGISEAQTTNLAVVAPGIAEALLATALGLVAAIPAVIIYNAFARSISGYRQLLADAGSAVQRLVSRDLDFRKVSSTQSGNVARPGAAMGARSREAAAQEAG